MTTTGILCMAFVRTDIAVVDAAEDDEVALRFWRADDDDMIQVDFF
jgi:hypothetical protein